MEKMIEVERLLPVEDFPGYLVSDRGHILRVGRGGRMIPCATTGRYVHIHIGKGKRKNVQIARLVLIAFKGRPPARKPLALHKDDRFDNNKLINLRWGSYKDNLEDRRLNGKLPSGENSPIAILSTKSISEIRKRYKGKSKGPSQQELADQYKVKQSTISKIVRGHARVAG